MTHYFAGGFYLRLIFALFFTSLSTLHASNEDYWDGEVYFNNSSSQKDAAADLMRYVELKSTDRVLDVGCGDGRLSAEIADKLPSGSVRGIDISPSMIDFACSTYQNQDHPNLTFALGDAQTIGNEAPVDRIFAFTSLQWLENHEAFLDGAKKILKAQGALAVTMPMGLPATIQQAVDEIVALPEWNLYFVGFATGWNFVTDVQYGKWLAEREFDCTRLAVVPQKDIFPTRQAFQGFISQWFPYLRPLPPHLKQTFMTLVIDRFLELETPFPGQEIHFKIRRLEVVAIKH